MREASPMASNWRADGTLRDYLVRHNIVAIADIDTRALTRVLRSAGVMRGVIATGHVDPAELVEKARAIPQMEGADLVRERHLRSPRSSGAAQSRRARPTTPSSASRPEPRVAAAARGGLRLRREVQHPAPADSLRLRRARVSGDGAGRRTCWPSSPTACS